MLTLTESPAANNLKLLKALQSKFSCRNAGMGRWALGKFGASFLKL